MGRRKNGLFYFMRSCLFVCVPAVVAFYLPRTAPALQGGEKEEETRSLTAGLQKKKRKNSKRLATVFFLFLFSPLDP